MVYRYSRSRRPRTLGQQQVAAAIRQYGRARAVARAIAWDDARRASYAARDIPARRFIWRPFDHAATVDGARRRVEAMGGSIVRTPGTSEYVVSFPSAMSSHRVRHEAIIVGWSSRPAPASVSAYAARARYYAPTAPAA